MPDSDPQIPTMSNSILFPGRPLIIAGPCSAESRRQTLDTCLALADAGAAHILRAGVWKPRTSPGQFEGAGEEGLEWLTEAKRLTGLPTAVEVATAQHVQAALDHGVDLLWIGARTTINPFAVQEIATAVGGMGVCVAVKNPVNPDPDVWAGAVERMIAAGVAEERIALVHRGFSYLRHSEYRNAPLWNVALEMRSRFPSMPMICDPSHIAGRRELLAEVAQRAADLRYDGLMMESHCSPEAALSDAAQQVTPQELARLLGKIKWRSPESGDPAFERELERLREDIDRLDAELLELLARRMEISESIGRIKRDSDVAILQQRRWRAIVEKAMARAEKAGMSREFMQAVLDAIHAESIDRQNRVMNRE